jgi:hypothetical protein
MQMLLKELNKAKAIDEWTAPNLTTEPCKAPHCHMVYYHPKGDKEKQKISDVHLTELPDSFSSIMV